MTTWADHNYKAENIDLIDDLREHGNGLGERREDILDSMLNLILNHKKEIQKIPSCTTLRGAQAWCDKRPGSGFRAHMADIGGDPENEVVVYDKAGKPVIINGYRIKPSDYGIRKLYREAVDKDPEAMIGTSMREWVTNQAWTTHEADDNKWDLQVTQNKEVYDRMKGWGYRMPSKPKAQATPYSIFSKLIAPLVKNVFNHSILYNSLASRFGIKMNSGIDNQVFINKIVSPISVYRFLYLRLVEQKYFWSLTETPATKAINTFEKFKKYTKANKDTFRRWFLNNIMSGDRKEVFKKAWVSEATILTNLIKDDIQLDGSDIQDGIVFLLSVANLKDKEPVEVVFNGTPYQFTFRQLLVDKDAAAKFNTVIKEKKNQNAKVLKRRLEKWKKNAEKSTKAYFQDERAKKLFFEDADGKAKFLQGLKEGLPNATSAGSAAFQKQNVSSPVKNVPVVEPVDEGVSADDVEFERFEKDDDDEPPIPAIDKGQRKMTDYFTPEE